MPAGSLQPSNLGDAIAAVCISVAAKIGGIALIVVSAGAATPGVAVAWGALSAVALGVGTSGMVNASIGVHNRKFSWESWGTDVGIAAGASLVAFPLCVIGGQAIT